MLYNLLSNAVKYTNIGHIVLKTKINKNGLLEFSIADTGIGMNKF